MFNLRLLLSSLLLLALLSSSALVSATDPVMECDCETGEICILETVGGGWGCVPATGNNFIAFDYLNSGILNIIYISAYGLTVLWLLVGGILYMIGRVDQGKQQIMWAVLGLLMLFFSGAILNIFNEFYTPGSADGGFGLTIQPVVEYLIPTAHAQQPPICLHLPGVNCEASNFLIEILNPVISLLLIIAGSTVVLMIVYGGMQLLLGFGSDGTIQKGKSTILMAMLGFIMVLTSQTVLNMVLQAVSSNASGSAATTGTELGFAISSIFDSIVGIVSRILTGLFVIVIIIAGFQLLFAEGKDDRFNRARTAIIWGVVGVVVVNLAQVIARVILSFNF